MLCRRRLLRTVGAFLAGAAAPAGVAAAPRRTEIFRRIALPATLGGARLLMTLPTGAKVVAIESDADHLERRADALVAVWRGGALAPRLEATIRVAGDEPLPRPGVATVAGPLPQAAFHFIEERRGISA